MNQRVVRDIRALLADLEKLTPAQPAFERKDARIREAQATHWDEYVAAVRKHAAAKAEPERAPARATRLERHLARKAWQHYMGELDVVPTVWSEPDSLAELVAVVESAGKTRRVTVRAGFGA